MAVNPASGAGNLVSDERAQNGLTDSRSRRPRELRGPIQRRGSVLAVRKIWAFSPCMQVGDTHV